MITNNRLITGEYFIGKDPVGICKNSECDYNKDDGCYFGYTKDNILCEENWINECNWHKR